MWVSFRLLDQVIDMAERREVDVQMSPSVAGLHSLQPAFSALLEGDEQKQVVLLTNVDDEQLIKVRAFYKEPSALGSYLLIV